MTSSRFDPEHQRQRALNRHAKPKDPLKEAERLRAVAAGMIRKADSLVASATFTSEEDSTDD